jgi:hypothetical protein
MSRHIGYRAALVLFRRVPDLSSGGGGTLIFATSVVEGLEAVVLLDFWRVCG